MYVIEAGIDTDVSLLQPLKALVLIETTVPGISSVANPEHPSKAEKPMCVTVPGIVTETRSEQPSKA